MSDHPKSPKNPFKFNAQTEEERKADQQNKGQAINKTDTLKFTINGTQGGRANVVIDTQDERLEASFIPEKDHMIWYRKIEGGNAKEGYSFALTLKDENSKLLLEDSDIEQLDLFKDSVLVARFDNGWADDLDHERHRPEIDKIKETFHDHEREFHSIAPKKDEDRDR
ncbi:hypothetical protein [Cochlodiniinecator piscidefendens]|uniref:hypothetical protein n=1 Tax=Cochlodiniinecator piscidefendens TaxID=2715756 RepID=UPI0014092532|nr:hypothetical protein [Cochlodiniinecator piscidefendens]